MKITANAGLANRLRILLGYREVCQRQGIPYTFVWLHNRFCGPLEDAFSIEGVSFEHASDPPPDAPAIPGKVNFKDIVQIYGIATKESLILNAYRQINFDPALIQASIIGKQAQLSVHARVTDLYKSTGIQLSPEDYFSHIECYSHQKSVFPLYLATDALELQAAFIRRYGKPNIITTAHLEPDQFRQSNLRDSIVDLLACSHSTHFLGTTGSSFSGAIQVFRRLNGHLKASASMIG